MLAKYDSQADTNSPQRWFRKAWQKHKTHSQWASVISDSNFEQEFGTACFLLQLTRLTVLVFDRHPNRMETNNCFCYWKQDFNAVIKYVSLWSIDVSNLSLLDVFTAAKLIKSLNSRADHLQRQSESLQPRHQISCRETVRETVTSFLSVIPRHLSPYSTYRRPFPLCLHLNARQCLPSHTGCDSMLLRLHPLI